MVVTGTGWYLTRMVRRYALENPSGIALQDEDDLDVDDLERQLLAEGHMNDDDANKDDEAPRGTPRPPGDRSSMDQWGTLSDFGDEEASASAAAAWQMPVIDEGNVTTT